MKHRQRGDAGAAMLVMMVVIMGVWFWHSGMWHGGQRGHMSAPVSATSPEKSALEQLDEAYAQGKINREEYLQKREDLMRR